MNHDQEHDQPHAAGEHAEHIATLRACAAECRRCAEADQKEGMDDCAAINQTCAEVCEATAGALERGGLPQDAIDALLAACAAVCRACAAECRRHDAEHCQRCAEACERCAEACAA